MTETPASRRRHRWDRGSVVLEAALLAAVAYVPFLASSPGRLSSDSKQALYVDPGAFLREAPFLWDPTVGAGTVPHQHIGYLWPMGPWFWLLDAVSQNRTIPPSHVARIGVYSLMQIGAFLSLAVILFQRRDVG